MQLTCRYAHPLYPIHPDHLNQAWFTYALQVLNLIKFMIECISNHQAVHDAMHSVWLPCCSTNSYQKDT